MSPMCSTMVARARGMMVTAEDGQISVNKLSSGELPDRNQTVLLSDKSAKKDAISLTNHGKEKVDISGWYILSERGSQMYVFRDTVLQPGQKVTITSQSSDDQGDLVWPDKKVWHKSKADAAYLYDAYGRLIDELQ